VEEPHPIPKPPEPIAGEAKGPLINVHANEASFAPAGVKQCLGVATESHSAVQKDFAPCGVQQFHHIRPQDSTVTGAAFHRDARSLYTGVAVDLNAAEAELENCTRPNSSPRA
jgi:hypothetical protein